MVDIDINDVRELIEALPTCPSLRKIDLSRIKLSDDGLQLMLKTVRPDQFREIVIQECDVTPASWDAVENYVSHGRISKFSIGDAQWPEESAQELEQLVQSRIDQVVNENALLKEKIQEIRRLVKTGQWSGNRTFAIGPGAEKLKSDLEAASN
jgi:hypothetical protein